MEKLPLTIRQKEILEYLGVHTRDYGYPPTVREICRATGLKSPRSVSQHLQALERKGYIHRGRDKSRAIRFLHRPDSLGSNGSDHAVALPLKGHVAAGLAVNGNEVDGASYYVDRGLFSGDGNFLMKVEGDCMVDAHILEGDLIVVSPEREAASGDVVVARIGGEVTVKRYEMRGGSEYLVSQMGPVKIDSKGPQVQILGRVVGLIRSAS
ncbi:MAG TPA: transcriptional repressor LexA [Candidatus Krumholzibacteria bacterium]|nr:transcriptional repressor LexA [Candidatus Krumholzibacteria bacterium]